MVLMTPVSDGTGINQKRKLSKKVKKLLSGKKSVKLAAVQVAEYVFDMVFAIPSEVR